MYYAGLKSVCEDPLIDLSLISGFTAVPGLMYPLVLPKVQPPWNCSKQMGGSRCLHPFSWTCDRARSSALFFYPHKFPACGIHGNPQLGFVLAASIDNVP